jgi:hypothetical protein
MSNIIRADCPSKFLPILPFDADIIDKTADNQNVTIEFEDNDIQPQDGLRICADLHGPNMMALLVFNGTRNLKSYPLARQIENDPDKKGQPTYVLGMDYQDLKQPRKINAPVRKEPIAAVKPTGGNKRPTGAAAIAAAAKAAKAASQDTGGSKENTEGTSDAE